MLIKFELTNMLVNKWKQRDNDLESRELFITMNNEGKHEYYPIRPLNEN